jgi:large subunit ribosomal protein L25
MYILTAEKRESGKNLDALRSSGKIPAVFYGAGTDSTPISISMVDFKKVFKEAGESSLVTLDIAGEKINTLIHEVVLSPVGHTPEHVDFMVVDMKKKTTVGVALEFDGISPIVKSGKGSLVKVLHEVEVECLPKDLPHSLTVDISSLATFEDQIHVSDINLPTGVIMITDVNEVVALLSEAKEEVEETAVPVDFSSIELRRKERKMKKKSRLRNNFINKTRSSLGLGVFCFNL